jgi:uncharacterized RDD family membrane protein YckC
VVENMSGGLPIDPASRTGGELPRRRAPDRDPGVVGRRVLACLLDCTLVCAMSAALLLPVLLRAESVVGLLVWSLGLLLLFCVLYTLYVAPLDGLWGGTLGKRAFGIEVVSVPDGARPGLLRAALRALTFLATDGLLGLLVVLRSPTHQRPGDVVTQTMVVRRPSS